MNPRLPRMAPAHRPGCSLCSQRSSSLAGLGTPLAPSTPTAGSLPFAVIRNRLHSREECREGGSARRYVVSRPIPPEEDREGAH